MTFKQLCAELEITIQDTYTQGVSLEEAEKMAAKFLYAQLQVSTELKKSDLSSKMRKAGVKSVRASVYLEGATKGDKKPSDVLLQAQVDVNELVQSEQQGLDESEADRDELERYYNIFREAHIYFRGISKGRFE